jgi:multidrug efflux pump
VYLQADAPFRMNPEDLNKLFVRNSAGAMVPFTSFATGHWTWGSPKLERYNGVSSFEIQGQAAPGQSTGQAMAQMERLMKNLPPGVGYEWTGTSLQEIQSGSQAPYLYALSILIVFLCLAALYESWTVPISVIMVVPLGILGALLAAFALHLENDVFFHVGLLTTIGLSAKNAILIVEFARDLEAQGKSAMDAAIEAAKLRLRPILMTSLAFVLGVLPLAIATGAGSGSENSVGRGVIGGMLTATFLAPFLVPMFFLVITEKVFKSKRGKTANAVLELAQSAASTP